MIRDHNKFVFVFSKEKIVYDNTFLNSHVFIMNNDRQLIFNKHHNTIILDGIIYCKSINSLKQEDFFNIQTDGQYSCMFVNDNYIYFLTDYLGFGHIYYFNSDGNVIISNDFSLCFEYVKKFKFTFSPNTDAFLNSFITGCTYYLATGISEIKLLENFKYIEFNIDTFQLNIKDNNFFKFIEDVVEKRHSYQDLIFQSKESIIQKISDIYNNDKRIKVLELTGGEDSRLGLAALLSQGIDDFKIYTSGKGDSFDRKFSRMIASLFDLNYISYCPVLTDEESWVKYFEQSAGVM